MALKLTRRALLRGIGGAAVGLPVLECMLDKTGAAYGEPMGGPPKRFALIFAGQALGGDGWAEDKSMVDGNRSTEAGHFIVPRESGNSFQLTTPLQPLAALRNHFSLVSNLRIPFNRMAMDAGSVPEAGAFREFHGGGCSPLLSGMRSLSGRFTCRGITSDQVVARMNHGKTTFDSLVLRAQPSWYLNGSSYAGRQYISYKGDNQPIEAQVSPQIAFQSLFSGFRPIDTAAAAEAEFRLRSRVAILDLVANKRQALLAKVGAADRRRLSQHFDEIADLERRIRALPPPSTAQCHMLADPGADPAIGGNNTGTGSDMIATDTGYSDEDLRAKLHVDLIHMAFVCDLTRVATLQVTVFQSHMNVYPISSGLGLPLRADLHEVGHNGDARNRGQLPVSTMLKWHISHYAQLVNKLASTPEGPGSVLDNSVVLFVPEAGHGTQLNDGHSENATHSVENMIMLVAGGAGGLKRGLHIDSAGAHPVQVLVSAMQAAGHTGDTLGEVRGNIPALFG